MSFLCPGVTKATHEDKLKLARVLGYLKAMHDKKLVLKVTGALMVDCYIDATFASHKDSKSQMGVGIFIGRAMVSRASRKQKCVTKSPM
jgi:hypothetical protein